MGTNGRDSGMVKYTEPLDQFRTVIHRGGQRQSQEVSSRLRGSLSSQILNEISSSTDTDLCREKSALALIESSGVERVVRVASIVDATYLPL
jgi:hypothetical protein